MEGDDIVRVIKQDQDMSMKEELLELAYEIVDILKRHYGFFVGIVIGGVLGWWLF